MGLNNPLAENPGALTLEEMKADREMADALSVRRNARKAVKQVQLALTANRQMPNAELALSAYGGARSLDNPLTFAVVEIGRHTWGGSGSLRMRNSIFGRMSSMAIGFDLQAQNDLRKNFAICTDTVVATVPTATCPNPGLDRGIITLDQRELVSSGGVYAADDIPIFSRVSMTLGIRADRVRFEVKDRLISSANPDDSGIRTLGSVNPVAGLVARIAQTHSIYTNVSSAFETPTATELGNHEDGSAGLNQDLDPQRSLTAEAGAKGWFGTAFRYDVSVFRTGVKDELVPFEIPASNGRRYFRNAGRTVRRGGELGVQADAGPLSVQTSYTYSRFRYVDYAVSGTSYAGNRIPGIPVHALAADASLRRGVLTLSATADAASGMMVDDANSAQTPGRVIFGTGVSGRFRAGDAELLPMVAVQNLGDVHYVGSVNVNAAGGKYYEPAPGRALVVRLSVSRASIAQP